MHMMGHGGLAQIQLPPQLRGGHGPARQQPGHGKARGIAQRAKDEGDVADSRGFTGGGLAG